MSQERTPEAAGSEFSAARTQDYLKFAVFYGSFVIDALRCGGGEISAEARETLTAVRADLSKTFGVSAEFLQDMHDQVIAACTNGEINPETYFIIDDAGPIEGEE